MKKLVVDASVAAKWFLPAAHEPYSAEATHLLDEFTSGEVHLMAPDLLWPEVGNLLWNSVRCGRVSMEMASKAVEALEQMGIRSAPMQPLMAEAFSIASAFDRTVYDSVYVALALRSGVPLVTADERLVRALAGRFPIRFLGAFG